jgi:hypothetical protein
LPPFLRLVHLAKITALIAQAWTIFYVVLIFGWQITTFIKIGAWPGLPLSSIFRMGDTHTGAILATGSIGKAASNDLTALDRMLQIPTVVLLLSATLLLAAFYLWLRKTERRYSANEK